MSTTRTNPRQSQAVEHEFVEFIPDELAPNTLYISIPYTTAVHSCMCGCGTKVVTPISPARWQLLFDGDTVSLRPSIGNWGFHCRSHYLITRGQVVWAGSMTDEEIRRVRQHDRDALNEYFEDLKPPAPKVPEVKPPAPAARGWFGRIVDKLLGGRVGS